jgi:hypothetical protein
VGEIAMLIAVTVFPSLGMALVIRTVFGGRSAEERRAHGAV